MDYGRQPSNNYTEEKMVLEDPDRIKALLSDLDMASPPERVLDPEEVNEDVGITATYELEHPYRGEEFMHCLLHDEEVTASVEVEVSLGDSETGEYSFNAYLTDNAYDIFDVPEAVDAEPELDEQILESVEEGEQVALD